MIPIRIQIKKKLNTFFFKEDYLKRNFLNLIEN